MGANRNVGTLKIGTGGGFAQVDPTTQFIAAVLSALAVFGAFAAWLVRHLDKRLDELKAYMDRRFDEAKADTQRQLDEAKADTDRRFDEAKADTQWRFDEANVRTSQGFDRIREDHLRLEKKLDAQAVQIADLRQDVGRLQGIVERTYQPARFTVPPAGEAMVGDEVREAPTSYDTGPTGEDPGRKDEL